MIKKTIIGLALGVSSLLASNSAQLNINSNTLELVGEYNLNDTYNLSSDAKYNFVLSYLGSEKTAISTRSKDRQVSAGFKMMNPYINDFGFSFGLGIDLTWANNSSKSFFATPLSIYGNYALNEEVSFDSYFKYSPSILTFSDGEKYQSFDLKANYKIIDNGYVYIGKRVIKTTYKNNKTLDFDNSIFFGYKVTF